MAITVPDVNQVMAQHERPPAAVWLGEVPAQAKQDRPRPGLFLGVKPDYRHTGVAAGLYLKHLERGRRDRPQSGGEMGWILETNEPMNRAMEGMGGKVVKRYRVYERSL